MTRTVIWLLALVCLVAESAPAAKTPPPTPSPNRYLFVVDTASAMSAVDVNLRQTFFDLIHSGLHGQMQPGDTFGVWTFSTDLDTSYPMSVWDPKRNLELASRATFFLKHHHYEKRDRLDVAMANIGKVINAAKDVTVFILSDGQERLQGTPFDLEINEIYKKNYAELHKAKSPFVTTLVARDGEIAAWSVVTGGEVVTLPLPPLPVTAAQKPVVKVLEQTNAVAAARPANETRTPASILINRANSGLPPAVQAAPPPPAVAAATQTTESASTATPASNVPKASEPATGAETHSARPVKAAVTISPPTTPPGVAKLETATLGQPALAPSAAPQEASNPAAPRPLPSLVPAQFTVAARERTSYTDLPLETPSATAVAPKPILSPRAMLFLSAVLFLAALGLIILIVRNFRASAQPSAITRSIQKAKQA